MSGRKFLIQPFLFCILCYQILKCILGFCRHLIGFFLFLALTIYTATKVPSVVDLQHRLPHLLRKTDLHKLHSDLMSRLPSSPSKWHLMELLYNCLPDRFSLANSTDMCVLVMKTQSFLIIIKDMNQCSKMWCWRPLYRNIFMLYSVFMWFL